jgi:hypothetical protein
LLFLKIRAAILWPRVVMRILRSPSFVISGPSGFGRLPPPRHDLSPHEREEVLKTMLGKSGFVLCNERELFAFYVISLLCAVIVLVTLNGAFDLLSELESK